MYCDWEKGSLSGNQDFEESRDIMHDCCWLPFACYVCRGLMDVAQLALFQCGWIAGSLAFDQQQSCIMSLDSSKSWFPEREPFSQSQYMRLCQFCAITLAAVWHKLIAIRYPLDICDVLRPRCHVIKIVQ